MTAVSTTKRNFRTLPASNGKGMQYKLLRKFWHLNQLRNGLGPRQNVSIAFKNFLIYLTSKLPEF